MPPSVLEMAKDLVMAQIRAGILAPEALQDALQKTYASLMALKAHEEADGSAAVGATPLAPPVIVLFVRRRSSVVFWLSTTDQRGSRRFLSIR